MRIALISPTLAGGGAERVATVLSNDWVSKGESVTVITFEAPGTPPGYALDSRVSLRQIDGLNRDSGHVARIVTNLNRLARLRRLLKEIDADVALAFTTEANVVTLCAARGLGIPVIISERNQPDRPGLGRLRASSSQADLSLRRRNRDADARDSALGTPTLQGSSARPAQSGTPRRDGRAGAEEDVTDRRGIVAVGRLVPQKGFDILIAAFAKIAAQHSDWFMTIYGEGPSRSDTGSAGARSGTCKRA